MNLPLCRKENRKNEPKTAQSGGFLCKMTKKSQKIRHFDRAPTFVSAGISAFWHFSTKNEANFVQNYLLTNSRKYGIIVSESEGTTMTLEELDRGEIEKGEEYGKGFAERLKEELLQNGLQCGFNGSKWYSLYEIEKFAKKVEKSIDKPQTM